MTTSFSCLILTTVAGITSSPIEVYIVLVFKKDILVAFGICSTINTRASTIVTGQQIMMECRRRAIPLGSIATGTLMMTRIVESFMDNTPLNSRKLVIIHRHVLLTAPSETTVVNDDVPPILNANSSTLNEVFLLCLCRITFCSQTRTDVTNNHVFRTA